MDNKIHKVLFDNVLIQPDEPPSVTRGGIVIPEVARYKTQQGTVLLVGDECQAVQPNQRVLFPKYGGSEVRIANQEFILMKETDVYAILNANGEERNAL